MNCSSLYPFKKFYQKPFKNNKTACISFSEMEARNKPAPISSFKIGRIWRVKWKYRELLRHQSSNNHLSILQFKKKLSSQSQARLLTGLYFEGPPVRQKFGILNNFQ